MERIANELERNEILEIKEKLQKELDDFMKKVKANDLSIRCSWSDEYGGIQSITLGNSDELNVIEF